MLRWFLDRDPMDYLKLLLISLLVLAISVVTIAIAEFLLQDGIVAEGIALIALIASAPAILVGSVSFVLMILTRLRTIFRRDDDEHSPSRH